VGISINDIQNVPRGSNGLRHAPIQFTFFSRHPWTTQRPSKRSLPQHLLSLRRMLLSLLSFPPIVLSVDCDHRNTGAFFPRAQHFTISGGTFTSNVIAPTVLHRKLLPWNSSIGPHLKVRGFRLIPLGDLDLLQEIRLEDASSVVHAKFYYVLVSRDKSKMTAAVYRGRSGEEVC
jgi:hypothetical protein